MPEERKFYVHDFSTSPIAEGIRRRQERDRAESRRRYRDHVAAAFARLGFPESAALADTALDALTDWRHQTDGEPCRCSCHPRLPDTELHDFGFDCPCARTGEQRRRAFEEFRAAQREFWASREGRRIAAAEEAEEDALDAFLGEQPSVVITEHGGACPEQCPDRWMGTASISGNATMSGASSWICGPAGGSSTCWTAPAMMAARGGLHTRPKRAT